MAAGRVVFGYDNTRPDIIPDPYTNIHTHQVNWGKKWTRTHRVSIGYRVSGGYATVKYKSACKLMSNTVYDRWELMNNITTCEIDKQHHQFINHRFIAQSGIGDAAGAQAAQPQLDRSRQERVSAATGWTGGGRAGLAGWEWRLGRWAQGQGRRGRALAAGGSRVAAWRGGRPGREGNLG
jgi:hypothetical protein